MVARPFWSGHIQISLVSFGVKLFPATEAKSEIRFHQLSRKTGERIRHQKVAASDAGSVEAAPIEKEEIVKGYEYRKGEYVTIEPGEIENLRIPSRHTLEVTQFVGLDELDPEFYERPYFVVPDGDQQAEAFAVVREALESTHKAALGKIAFGGREHLVAICAPHAAKEDSVDTRGMMAYTLRYADELRKPADYFADIKKVNVDSDQLSLAKELIKRKEARFDPRKFKDEYEVALKQLVEAKINNAPLPQYEPVPKSGKIINLMDALRRSVKSDEALSRKKPPAKESAAESSPKKGISLVKTVHKVAKSTRPRKSA